MNELLKIILSLSVSGALLILVLLLCKPLVKDKLSKRWQYYIWLVVVARLLLPFAPETNLVGTLFQYIDNAVIQTDTSPRPEQQAPVLPETDFSNQGNVPGQVGSGGEQSEPNTLAAPSIFDKVKQNIAAVCLLVWLIVAACLLIRKITIYQSFVKYIKAGRTEIADMELWERVGKLIEQTGVKGAVGLYTNSLISSPLLIGFFRPCIMLPTTELSESDFENTILHELTHYKRRDMFYKWLVQATICLHWFNPLVYLMGREVNRACELSCDEAVIKSMDVGKQRAYGDTLLNAVGIGGDYKNSLATVTLNESAELLKERLDSIMRFQKKSKFVVSITLLVTILFCAAATTVGAYAATSAADNNTPWSNMGGTGQPYTYSQTGYFQGAYIFELGWNLNEKSYNAYVDKANLTLSDGTVIAVSFDKSCKEDLQDKEMLADLKELVETLKKQSDDSTYPLEKPLVVSVKYVGNRKLVELAKEYYDNGELTRFSAIFSSLDIEIQKEYCNKMVDETKLAFFSSCAPKMNSDIIDYFAEKTYRENQLTFFTNVVPHLTDSQKQTWIARASRDNRNTFLAVLTREDNGNQWYSGIPTPPDLLSTDNDAEMEIATIGSKTYYFIETEQQLRAIGSEKYTLDSNYLLNNDIQLSEEWISIGDYEHPFTGYFDGNGFEIVGLKNTDPNAVFIGLFGYAKDATIHNVTLRDVDIASAGGTGKHVGAIVAIAVHCEVSDNQIIE